MRIKINGYKINIEKDHFANIEKPRDNPSKIENFLFLNLFVLNKKQKLNENNAVKGKSSMNCLDMPYTIGNKEIITTDNNPIFLLHIVLPIP